MRCLIFFDNGTTGTFVLANWLFVTSYLQLAYRLQFIAEYKNPFFFERRIKNLSIAVAVIIVGVVIYSIWADLRV